MHLYIQGDIVLFVNFFKSIDLMPLILKHDIYVLLNLERKGSQIYEKVKVFFGTRQISFFTLHSVSYEGSSALKLPSVSPGGLGTPTQCPPLTSPPQAGPH